MQRAFAPQGSMGDEQGKFDDDFADSAGENPGKKGGNNCD